MTRDGPGETSDRTAEVLAHPEYHRLVRRRSRFGWSLTAVMLLAYFAYILLIAFDKEYMAQPIGEGVTSIGIPLGFGLIILGVLLTGIYVYRANREFDSSLAQILSDLGE